ncbi:S8 family serine peptidase [Coralloluteibacterium stylophorae]|uniref:S8 family serine peptidase n=1 Tax=Coralloluteibacterium stylophorae TaxID=1776034 RepID=A0AAP2CCP1_9GAMM|nr:S8 family serine peptidase [Coralloluteibacterium stylophorae]
MNREQGRVRRQLLAAMVAVGLGMPLAQAGTPHAGGDIGGKAGRALTAGLADGGGYDRIIVKYRDGTPERANATRAWRDVQGAVARGLGVAAASGGGVSVQHLRRMGVGADVMRLSSDLDAVQMRAVLREIARLPGVEFVEPDVRHKALYEPSDPDYASQQWHYYEPTGGINLPPAWDRSTGEGITVAVLDTGIVEHEDLDTSLAGAGWDFITDSEVSDRADDFRAPGAWDTGDWYLYLGIIPVPSSWHGSHVAGTIAALTDNGLGGAGVAWDADVLPMRVLGHEGGYISDIADAIYWASGAGPVDSGPGGAEIPANTAHKADVINLSLGGSGACDGVYQAAIDAAIAQNTAVVVAAGNGNNDVANNRPANCDGVIAVASNNRYGEKAGTSSYGAGISVTAPGDGVWSTINSGEETPVDGGDIYAAYSGTSMATPHVAATIALVQAAVVAAGGDKLTPEEVRGVLEDTARPLPVPADVGMGAGIINAEAAIAVALGEDPPPPPDVPPPPEPTLLENGVPVEGLAAGNGEKLRFRIEVPADATTLTVEISGGSGDADVYVRQGEPPTSSTYDCRPWETGNDEVCTFESPEPGTWYVNVEAYEAFEGVTLVATHDGSGDGEEPPPDEDATPVENGEMLTDLAGAAGDELLYAIEVPEGARNLRILTLGGTGDVSLYASLGEPPTAADHDASSTRPGNNETVSVRAPEAGTWYVRVIGESAFDRVRMRASYQE